MRIVFQVLEHTLRNKRDNFRNIVEKNKMRFPTFVFTNIILLPLWSIKKKIFFLPNRQNLYRRVCEISMTWFEMTTPHQANKNHARKLSTAGHLVLEWCSKGTFYFTVIVKKPRLKRGKVNSVSSCEIYFPLFFEIIHSILKNMLHYAIMQCGLR